ncbi:MAG TPA: hypothetical protein VFQ53_41795 [Kofleriaceae bacterium]|nr:hypothetical protein [Kofleriaceae bacterium]
MRPAIVYGIAMLLGAVTSSDATSVVRVRNLGAPAMISATLSDGSYARQFSLGSGESARLWLRPDHESHLALEVTRGARVRRSEMGYFEPADMFGAAACLNVDLNDDDVRVTPCR